MYEKCSKTFKHFKKVYLDNFRKYLNPFHSHSSIRKCAFGVFQNLLPWKVLVCLRELTEMCSSALHRRLHDCQNRKNWPGESLSTKPERIEPRKVQNLPFNHPSKANLLVEKSDMRIKKRKNTNLFPHYQVKICAILRRTCPHIEAK